MSISICLILSLILCILFQACHPKNLHSIDKELEKKLQVSFKEESAEIVFCGAECMELLASKEAKVRESERRKLKRREITRKASWHVPHQKKPKEKNPGFSSDYEHARTHPPSHN